MVTEDVQGNRASRTNPVAFEKPFSNASVHYGTQPLRTTPRPGTNFCRCCYPGPVFVDTLPEHTLSAPIATDNDQTIKMTANPNWDTLKVTPRTDDSKLMIVLLRTQKLQDNVTTLVNTVMVVNKPSLVHATREAVRSYQSSIVSSPTW